jgi:hypothetical protein
MFKGKSQNRKTKPKSIEKNSIVGLTDEQKAIFDKYANKYNVDKGPTKEKNDNVEREKYVYELLNRKGVENTAIEKLLELTIKDIELQYSMKQAMEYKIGFMIALWGVLVAAIMQDKVPVEIVKNIISNSTNIGLKIGNGIILGGLIISGIVSLVYIALALLYNPYCKFKFDKRDDNFRCAVEDKNMLLVKLLDSNTTVWEKNENANEKKFDYLKMLVIWIIVFIVFIILCFCFVQGGS